jgi:hypothetical protein
MPRTYNPIKLASRHKYGAKATTVDGIRFASKFESERYGYLKSLERAGVIRSLQLQPRYKLAVNGILICTYVADFSYEREGTDGSWTSIVEDAKGVETPEFKLKKKLMQAVLGIEINVVKKAS